MADNTYPIALASSAEKCARAMENLTKRVNQTTEAFQQQAAAKLKKIQLTNKTAGEPSLPNTPAGSATQLSVVQIAGSGERFPVLEAMLPPLSSAVGSVTEFTESNAELVTGLSDLVEAIEKIEKGAGAFKEAKQGIGNLWDSFKFDKAKPSAAANNTTDQKTHNAKQNSGAKQQNKSKTIQQKSPTQPRTAGSNAPLGTLGKLIEAIQSGVDLVDSGTDLFAKLSDKETSKSKNEAKSAQAGNVQLSSMPSVSSSVIYQPKQSAGTKKQHKEAAKQKQSAKPRSAGGNSGLGKLLEAIQSGMDLIDLGADLYARFSGKETSESKGETKPALPQTSAAQSSSIKSSGGSSVTSEVKTAPASGAVSTIATGFTEAASVFQEIEKGVGAVKQIKESIGSVFDAFKPNEESSPSNAKAPNAKKSMDRTIKMATRSIDRLNRTIRFSNMGAGGSKGGRKRSRKSGRKGSQSNRNVSNRLPRAGYQNIEKQKAKVEKTKAPSAGKATGFNRIKGLVKTVGSGAGKLFRPLNAVMQAPELISAISTGDSKEIGATAGNMAGGLGGAAAGALAGAAIGSVVPVIGTAVGGLIGSVVGGMGGSSIGEWAGSKVGGWFSDDKTDQPVPDAVSNQTKQLQEGNKAIHFAPVINLTPTGNPAYDQDVSNQVIERLKAEFAQGAMLNMDVATRADASLSDNRSS